MPIVRVIHWDEREAEARAARLRAAGYAVASHRFDLDDLRAMKKDPPAALVIDLSRLPSQGRDVALALRKARATRSVPIVFVGGQAEKIRQVKRHLPDAVYASWRGIRGALRRALEAPPPDPVVPVSNLAGYAGTPLPRKLGIKPGATVALVGAPRNFESTLGPVPAGTAFRRRARGRCDLVLWFVRSRKDLTQRIGKMAGLMGPDGLWICWPKRASGLATDLTAHHVRAAGLDQGLVDYKIAAIDPTWSGLKFAWRRPR